MKKLFFVVLAFTVLLLVSACGAQHDITLNIDLNENVDGVQIFKAGDTKKPVADIKNGGKEAVESCKLVTGKEYYLVITKGDKTNKSNPFSFPNDQKEANLVISSIDSFNFSGQ